MKAMLLHSLADLSKTQSPLKMSDIPIPKPGRKEVLLKVLTCGVCHTELDEIEGRTPPSFFPIALGHQVVGRVVQIGKDCTRYAIGDRVGIAWIYSSCGACRYCREGNENLCPDFKATGRDAHGGYAEYMVSPEDYIYPIPEVFSDEQAAPLLCAGAIGYRSLRLTGLPFQMKKIGQPSGKIGRNGQIRSLGLTGFGASAHLVLKMVRHLHPDWLLYVFARSESEREFALHLGAVWAGNTTDHSPVKLDAIIDTTPVWKPVVEALNNLRPGGRLVINAIRKENVDKEYLMKLEYDTHLWMEKEMKSVANVAARDVSEFLVLAAEIPLKPDYQVYPLEKANLALTELKQRKIRGAKVLRISN
jgi:propanol-preferring alcohol dehydrogenase